MSYRILHSIASVNPAGGGPIEGIKQLAATNSSKGHSVSVMSLDRPTDPWVRACPVECYALGPTLVPRYGFSPRLVRWLRENHARFDVVIVNGIWQFSSFGVHLALLGTTTPYVVFTHGMLDPWFKRQYPLKHVKKWLYWPWAEYRVLRDARAVLFTCEEERLLARQSFWLYRCREHVVNYGTRAPTGDVDQQRETFLARFPHLRGRKILLFLGRVHVKKGTDLVFKALTELRQSAGDSARENIHLVMAGPHDHEYGRRMERLARSLGLEHSLTWTGMLAGDLKWGAFHAADAFILPSHQENFGIAVVEALACGVPVLISSQVNIWREIEADGAGFVQPDTFAGTRRLLEQWLTCDPVEWARMRQRAKVCFARRFDIERTGESLVAALNQFGVMAKSGVSDGVR